MVRSLTIFTAIVVVCRRVWGFTRPVTSTSLGRENFCKHRNIEEMIRCTSSRMYFTHSVCGWKDSSPTNPLDQPKRTIPGSVGQRYREINSSLLITTIMRDGNLSWMRLRGLINLLYFLKNILGSIFRHGANRAIVKKNAIEPLSTSYSIFSRPKVHHRIESFAMIREEATSWQSHEKIQSITVGEKPPSTPRIAKIISWILSRLIYMRALRVEGLNLSVHAKSNLNALSGNIDEILIRFQTLALPQIQITRGASICITGVDLKMLSVFHRKLAAFKKPFCVRGEYHFTNNDFIASSSIRTIVQCILAASFKRLNLGTVEVTRVGLRNDRIYFDGKSNIMSRFSCSAALDISKNGHVISLKSLKYGSQDGEFLFRPPWELAADLPRELVSCDIGDNTRIEHLSIKNGILSVGGYFNVTPTPKLIVADVEKRGMVMYDVGEKVSSIVSLFLDNALSFRL